MTIANTLRKINALDLIDRLGQSIPPASRRPRNLGVSYIRTVRDRFIESLPDQDDDIYAHIKNRDDARWGLTLYDLAPFRLSAVADDLGLLSWPHQTAERITPAQVLSIHLGSFTTMLVDVLCEAAVQAYDEPPLEYTAIINTPGYLPSNPVEEFVNAREAWQYLAMERGASEDVPHEDDYSDTQRKLWELSEQENPPLGSVWGPTPGYEGDHDLGLVYTVTHTER
jgi:hypothetical protein